MKRSGFLVLFFLVSILHLASLQGAWARLESFTKPLIVLSLLGYYLLNAPTRSFIFILALAFCCLGDSLLLFQAGNEMFFILGLGSFLVAHIFYIVSYRQHCFIQPGTETMGTKKVRLAFPVVLAGTGLVVVLLPSLGVLKIPVMIYALILTLMVVSAIFRLGRTSATSFWMVLSGALLFMVSDSLLASNKFLNPLAHASLWIMVTYCGALFFIVEGIRRHALVIETSDRNQ